MASRFGSNLLTLLAGALLLTSALAFTPATIGWIALAAGCAVVLVVLVAFPLSGRGIVQRVLDLFIALTAAWTIVASRTFTAAPLKWLTFADGAALLLLGVLGLVLHEAAVELELRAAPTSAAGNGRRPDVVHDRVAAGAHRVATGAHRVASGAR